MYRHLRGISVCNISSSFSKERQTKNKFLVSKNTNAHCTRTHAMMEQNYLPVFLSIHFVSFHFDKLPVEWFIAYTQTLDRLHSQPHPELWTECSYLFTHNRARHGSRISDTNFYVFFSIRRMGAGTLCRVCWVFSVRTLEISPRESVTEVQRNWLNQTTHRSEDENEEIIFGISTDKDVHCARQIDWVDSWRDRKTDYIFLTRIEMLEINPIESSVKKCNKIDSLVSLQNQPHYGVNSCICFKREECAPLTSSWVVSFSLKEFSS